MPSPALPSSFRDPSGFVFYRDGSLYRHVNPAYREDYEHLMRSGLYEALVADGLLIPHVETSLERARAAGAWRVIKPEVIPFISYPYEWCFSELKAAALATLRVQGRSLEFGMSLKDASAYNIQFRNGSPVLIDTLSFRRHEPNEPWAAYRQFCQHFLAPLTLMSYRDVRLSQLLRIYVDGVPLDLASALLPRRTWLSFGLLSHLHMHARSERQYADKPVRPQRKMGRYGLAAVISNLEEIVGSLTWESPKGGWTDYYDKVNYSAEAHEHKKRLVSDFIEDVAPSVVWDLGANTGLFSEIAAGKGALTIAFDNDPAVVEQLYMATNHKEARILPLVLDLTNPSASIGWANEERASLQERGPADATLALALIHHLAIGNNVPLSHLAKFFARVSKTLLIEFIPKSDSLVQRMLATREDVFADYSEQAFEREFSKFFTTLARAPVRESERTIYRMQRKPA